MTQTAATGAAAPTPTIRIFRPGQFVSAEGQNVSFGLADLEATAAAYDGESDPAPLVVGHPQMHAPAYGWVKRLAVVNGELVAEAGDIEASFAEQVRARRYRKVSASFYSPAHHANPTPGVWALRHVGFLGAMPPAVRGLGTVDFAQADSRDLALTTSATLAKDPPVIDTPAIETPAVETSAATADVAEVQTENERLKAELARRDQEAAERAAAETRQSHVDFAEGLIKAGKLLPAGQAAVVGLLDVLATADTASFGEGEAQAPADVFRQLFDAAQTVISFGEHPDPGAPEAGATASFAAPAGYTVDEDKAQLHARAKALQAKDAGLSFADAVAQASAG